MSLQLPAILSPPTPCCPSPALTVSPLERSPKLPCPLRVGVRFWASLSLRKLANASGRIVFNIALFMDWQFISGCLPPRLSTTQFPSTTDSQCSVRWGLPPHGWCALSGARRVALLRDRRCMFIEREQAKWVKVVHRLLNPLGFAVGQLAVFQGGPSRTGGKAPLSGS